MLRARSRQQVTHLKHGVRDLPGGLYQDSSAFRAYIELRRLPLNATPFKYASNGVPIVYHGEYICRMKQRNSNDLCGRLHGGKRDLVKHLEQDHQQVQVKRHAAQDGTNGRKQARDFYETLMRDEINQGRPSDEAPTRPSPHDDATQDVLHSARETDHPHHPPKASAMGRAREEPIDLTSSREPEEIKVEESAATEGRLVRQSAQQRTLGAGGIKEAADPLPEPQSPKTQAAKSIGRDQAPTTSQKEKRPALEDDSDEDLELELKKTDLELRRIELQQKLRKKRRMA